MLLTSFAPHGFTPFVFFTGSTIYVEAGERAVAGTWTADVLDIIPPADPEGSHNFTYSVVAGDTNDVFGIGSSFASALKCGTPFVVPDMEPTYDVLT